AKLDRLAHARAGAAHVDRADRVRAELAPHARGGEDRHDAVLARDGVEPGAGKRLSVALENHPGSEVRGEIPHGFHQLDVVLAVDPPAERLPGVIPLGWIGRLLRTPARAVPREHGLRGEEGLDGMRESE